MTDKKFQRFGKYLILDHLVDGGMAKICRARFLGEQADKIVAIKMVQPQFSKDPSFVKMFEDELKVTFALMHPNIAQTYDYGMVDDQLYTAMEYVDGANLKQFLDRLKKKNFVFPVEISTYIISQVCQALNYAHTFKDKMTGKTQNIIHRDISPHNIMLTYDGAVKVIDFGIAKADSNSEATQAGTIKGKLSYLAPEYLDGLELDPRYDLFAVGITLWELLCSRRLFTAANDLAVLKQIQACKVPPPSSINPNVPKELDQIVLKALSKNRDDRFEDMDKFNRALVKFLYSHYPDFNPSDLGYFAKQLFKEEIERDHEKFVEYGKIDIKPFINDLENASQGEKESKDATGGKSIKEVTNKIVLDFGQDSMDTKHIRLSNHGAKKRSPGTRAQQGPGATTINRNRKSGGATRTRTKTGGVSSKTRTKSLSRKAVQREQDSKSPVPIFVVAGLVAIAFLQPKLVERLTGFNPKEAILGASSSTSKKKTENDGNQGIISFVGYDTMMKVYINNQPVNLQGIDAPAPVDKELELKIVKEGYKPYYKSVTLSSTNEVYNVYIPELEKEKIGLLTTSLNYPSGTKLLIKVNGREVEKELPLKNERIPAGSYEAKVINPLLGTEKKVNLNIEENKKHFLE
jgi:serine/threonine protein kinase